MERGFDGSYLPEQVGTFSYAKTGGYIVSGKMFTSELCFGDVNCKFVTVYGVDSVSADNWLYDINGAYGIIGVGPRSHIWEGFVDNETKKASYSIELARVHILSSSTQQKSNITFGATEDPYFIDKANLTASAGLNYSYPLSYLSYGIVYQSND